MGMERAWTLDMTGLESKLWKLIDVLLLLKLTFLSCLKKQNLICVVAKTKRDSWHTVGAAFTHSISVNSED